MINSSDEDEMNENIINVKKSDVKIPIAGCCKPYPLYDIKMFFKKDKPK
jgi:hypothetical protein